MSASESKKYTLAAGEQARNEFNNYIARYVADLKTKLQDIEEQLKILNIIADVIEKGNGIEELLTHKAEIINFDRTLENDLAKLSFFIEEQAQDLPQYQAVIDKIKNNNVVLNCVTNKNILQNQQTIYLTKIKECEAIISGDNYNFDLLIDLLLNSNLSADFQIAILCQEAYKSSQFTIAKEPKKKDPVHRKQTQVKVDEKVDISIQIADYKELLGLVQALLDKHREIHQGKKIDSYRYAQIFIDCMREEKTNPTDETIDINDLRNIEAALALSLLILLRTKADLSELMQDINEEHLVQPDMAEYLDCLLDEFKSYYDFALTTSAKNEANRQEETNSPLTNIIFLLDKENKPYIDIPENNELNKNRAAALIKKLNNGQYDYARGIVHSRVMTKSDINLSIFVNRDKVMACAYVRLSDNLALVLCVGAVEDIYNNSQTYFRNNAEVINKLRELAVTKTSELLAANQEANNYVASFLGIGKEGLSL